MPHHPNDVITTISSHYNQKRYEFTVRFHHLESMPLWLTSEENPPLSARKAIALATDYLPVLVAEAPRWNLQQLGLRQLWDAQQWVYVVAFKGFHPHGVFDGAVSMMTLVVLMNGQVVEPDVFPLQMGA